MEAVIRSLGGVPTLFVDGRPEPGVSYITYLYERGRYRQFAEAGYRLFSMPVFFGDQPLNEQSGIQPLEPALFPAPGVTRFDLFDAMAEQIVREIPDARLLPRVNLSVPHWWEAQHPEECNETSVIPGCPRACFSSRLWQRECGQMLQTFLEHTEKSRYARNIIGYQVACGSTEEWFGFDQQGSTGKRTREAFSAQYPDGDAAEYRKFVSRQAADAAAYFCSLIKKQVRRKVITGLFYGYICYVPEWERNHFAIRRLLDHPDIDFFCSPAAYNFRNQPEHDWPCMVPLESLKHHGKLYFEELDTRTSLTRPLSQCRKNACPPDQYAAGVWQGPATLWESIHLLRANFCRQLMNGHASWWFDMWGGWYDDPEIMAEMKRFREIAAEELTHPDRTMPAELAIYVDEEGCAMAEDAAVTEAAVRDNIAFLGQLGTPFHLYEIGDFTATADHYKAVLLLTVMPTEKLVQAVQFCREKHLSYLLADRTHPSLTITQVKELCRDAGIRFYLESGDAVYAKRDYVAIHARTDGEKVVDLGAEKRIEPLMEGEAQTSRYLHLKMKQSETQLFRLLPAENHSGRF